MAIAVGNNSSGTTTGPGATFDVTKPTGADGSSIMIFAIGSANDFEAGSGSWTAPAGWTQVALVDSGSSIQPMTLQGFWSLGSNTNLTFTKSGSVGYLGWAGANFTGVDTSTPIDVAGTGDQSTGSASVTASSITIVTDQAWDIVAATDWNVAGGTFSASGFTTVQCPGTAMSTSVLYNTTPKGTGATGTLTVTGTGGVDATNRIQAIRLALRPAAGGAVAGPPLQGSAGDGALMLWSELGII